MFKYLLALILLTGTAQAGFLQNSDFASSAQITGAGGVNSQLLNTSKIWDSGNAQLLDTTISGLVAGSGITQLTGDVTAGPGAGSVAATIAANAVSDTKLRDSAALSVIGRSVNSGGDPADIAAGADFNILRRSGAVIGFGSIDLSQAGAVGASVLANANTTATSANTASAIVARDGSGNFSAGTISASLSGNSTTATALAANPADCGAGTKAVAIAANGDLTCSAVNLTADVSNVLPTANSAADRTINSQAGASYTFVLSDGAAAGGHTLVLGSNAGAQTFTVPPNGSVAYPTGDQIEVCQMGAGALTLAQGVGVTINSNGGNKTIGAQYVCVSLIKTAVNTWLLVGNLIP